MKLNPRELIFMGLMIALLLGAWLLVLKPRGEEMDRMEAQIQEKQRVLEEIATNRPRAIRNMTKDIEELETFVADQNARLPQGEKIEKVFKDLSALATSNDLRIQQIRTNQTSNTPNLLEDPAAKKPDVEEQGFLLELEGDYQGIQSFLERLEKQPRIIRVDEIRITRVSEKNADGSVHASLRLRVFSRKGMKTS